ncbi:HNH endonuclease [Bacillus thuringiensis serovar andalousiensis]|uniref:HNH endonuclease n=2 Tax=Bacillus thuringiensis TaxID=1428 RepID=A0A9X6KEC2_BACTU|nr:MULTISPECIES: HNH endonuclease signature motif containing protein [Bacillus cereus group]MDA2612061.1 HNH endonuclease signature motif containing protein [Bacillus cereus]MEB8556165.1 HNH endonuclease signature motif containing protein [Bacillus cereus]MEB8728183.1 HNH endonuclease signature motif containing protein [Bacillus cereus]MEB8824080.1 HNH endonuclease signature motif containing protein [Bacillus cereus]MEB8974655.1 HNH endonuclease signature motif containing protein [Bacillus cer
MKHCKSCGLDLPLDMFNKNKRNRDGLQFYCKECTSRKGKDYYQRNKASVNQKHRNHYYKNKEKRNEQIAKWSRENRDKRRDIDKRSYQKNREKRIEKSMQWIRNNLERHAERNQIRRAKIRDLDATFTSEEWIECKRYFANRCAYCGESVEKLEQEHFISIENGGPFTKENMLPACKSCNSSKRDRDFYKWYPRQLFYSEQRENTIIKYLKQGKSIVTAL